MKYNISNAFQKVIISAFLISLSISVSAQVPAKAEDISPLLIGEKAPQTIVYDLKGDTINLRRVYAAKPTILLFFRGNWCPFCTAHLAKIQEKEKELTAMGYQIVAISADQMTNIPTTLEKGHLSYQVYSDSKMETQKAFGIAFKDDGIVKKYNGLLQKASGEEHGMLPVPSVFVLDKRGKILFEYINVNIKDRINEEILLLACKVLKDKDLKY